MMKRDGIKLHGKCIWHALSSTAFSFPLQHPKKATGSQKSRNFRTGIEWDINSHQKKENEKEQFRQSTPIIYIEERSSYIVLIPGRSETDRMHLSAIPRTSFIPLSNAGFPISGSNAESKHSVPRPSATLNRTQSVKSTPPPSPEMTSPAHRPVNNSRRITPKA